MVPNYEILIWHCGGSACFKASTKKEAVELFNRHVGFDRIVELWQGKYLLEFSDSREGDWGTC